MKAKYQKKRIGRPPSKVKRNITLKTYISEDEYKDFEQYMIDSGFDTPSTFLRHIVKRELKELGK